jgi:hypothetical protein
MSDSEVRHEEERLREKASEFEQALDRLMNKIQDSSRVLRSFGEEASHLAESVKKPGALFQPYLEEGMHLAEDYLKKYIDERRSSVEHYINDSVHAIEEGTDRFVKNFGKTIRSQIETIEARPLIPGVALFIGGFLLGGLALGRRGRPIKEQRGVPGLRRATPSGTAMGR